MVQEGEANLEKKKMVPMLQILVNLHKTGKHRGMHVTKHLPSPVMPHLAPRITVCLTQMNIYLLGVKGWIQHKIYACANALVQAETQESTHCTKSNSLYPNLYFH